jgi:hypothetical protein
MDDAASARPGLLLRAASLVSETADATANVTIATAAPPRIIVLRDSTGTPLLDAIEPRAVHPSSRTFAVAASNMR